MYNINSGITVEGPRIETSLVILKNLHFADDDALIVLSAGVLLCPYAQKS